jgi:hypothetical protein
LGVKFYKLLGGEQLDCGGIQEGLCFGGNEDALRDPAPGQYGERNSSEDRFRSFIDGWGSFLTLNLGRSQYVERI